MALGGRAHSRSADSTRVAAALQGPTCQSTAKDRGIILKMTVNLLSKHSVHRRWAPAIERRRVDVSG